MTLIFSNLGVKEFRGRKNGADGARQTTLAAARPDDTGTQIPPANSQ
jgi:hypothetical protein